MYALYYAYRAIDGSWGAPLFKLTAASATNQFPINPALAPGNTSLWFVASGSGLFEGHP